MITEELLKEGYLSMVATLPPVVRGQLPKDLVGQSFRYQLFLAALGQPVELTLDQIKAGQLSELIALAVDLTPPAFDPTATRPGQLGQQRANAYASQYLLTQYTATLSQVDFTPQLVQELTIHLEDLILAQINHLPLNFHQRISISNALSDRKYRAGGLGALTVRHALNASLGADMVDLLAQVGGNLATAHSLRQEVVQLADPAVFTSLIRTGNYPLALLFARTSQPQLVSDFFQQAHLPSQTAFEQLRSACQKSSYQVGGLAKDLLKQVHYDLATLPNGLHKAALTNLLAAEEAAW